MACISSAQRARLTADLAQVEAQLVIANASYTKALEAMDVEEYRFNSGEGSQMARQQDIKKLDAVIESLEARRDKIIRKLEGRGLVNLNMRRKRYNGYY